MGFNNAKFARELGKRKVSTDRIIKVLDTVESTSSLLVEMVKKGARAGTLVATSIQTKGRGRTGKSWHSEKTGNLYISLAVKIPAPKKRMLPLVSLTAGVSVIDALRHVGFTKALLKWPNDVMVGNLKLAGILCEAPFIKKKFEVAVVGLGVNIKTGKMPGKLNKITTDMWKNKVKNCTPERLGALWIDFFERRLAALSRDKVPGLIESWKKRAEKFGRKVASGNIEGTTFDLDSDGYLLMKTDDGKIISIPGGVVE